MFFLFGWGHRTLKDFGSTYAVQCPNCSNTQFWNLVHVRLWFTLFFIPVFPYESKHLLLCPICQQGIKLAGRQVARAEELNKHSLAFLNKTISKEEYMSQLDRLDPLAIEPSGATKGGPIIEAPKSKPAVPPPLPPPLPGRKAIQFSFYDPAGAVRTEVFSKDSIMFGSNAGCDLILPGLSPQHCRIYQNGESFFVEDLGGGISINGRAGSGNMNNNDVLEVGPSSFRINILETQTRQ